MRMMFDEDDLLPISGLQHLVFCERQWALIHIEQFWEENRLTAEGRVLHERVHDTATESRPGVVVARGLRLQSRQLGLTGQADVVEFHRIGDGDAGGVQLPEREGWWRPFPVEYKRGRPKANACDEVQLCAQALCLEEMFSVAIRSGALFYGTSRGAGARSASTVSLRRKRQSLRGACTNCTRRGSRRGRRMPRSARVAPC